MKPCVLTKHYQIESYFEKRRIISGMQDLYFSISGSDTDGWSLTAYRKIDNNAVSGIQRVVTFVDTSQLIAYLVDPTNFVYEVPKL